MLDFLLSLDSNVFLAGTFGLLGLVLALGALAVYLSTEKQSVTTEVLTIRSVRTVWVLPAPPQPPMPRPVEFGPFGVVHEDPYRHQAEQQEYERRMRDYHIQRDIERRQFELYGTRPGYPSHIEMTFEGFDTAVKGKLGSDYAVGQRLRLRVTRGDTSKQVLKVEILERVADE